MYVDGQLNGCYCLISLNVHARLSIGRLLLSYGYSMNFISVKNVEYTRDLAIIIDKLLNI